ncbi:hypothetical protein E2C01_035763 [Portunus trituberculatus]|uniref:Uncharacterized protein n=1 Tax=Portunus trituberculatus TaxID=210409 RepID=A0A5B7FA74_PORTR|nr:hypothetical protein [Portunus trituberculatus]
MSGRHSQTVSRADKERAPLQSHDNRYVLCVQAVTQRCGSRVYLSCVEGKSDCKIEIGISRATEDPEVVHDGPQD